MTVDRNLLKVRLVSNRRQRNFCTLINVDVNVQYIIVLIGHYGNFTSDATCMREGDIYVATARRTYYGPSVMPPMMTWKTTDKDVVHGTLDVTNGTEFTSTINVLTTPSISPYYTCTTHFGSPTSVVIPGTIQANNAPTYSDSIVPQPVIFMRE